MSSKAIPLILDTQSIRLIKAKEKTSLHFKASPQPLRWAKNDLLWVRETFAAIEKGSGLQQHPQNDGTLDLIYKADERDTIANVKDWEVRGYRWVPSARMPKFASRLTLKVKSVILELNAETNLYEQIVEFDLLEKNFLDLPLNVNKAA